MSEQDTTDTPAPALPAVGVIYNIDTSGVVTRADNTGSVILATFVGGVLTYADAAAVKYHVRVLRFLKSRGHTVTSVQAPQVEAAPILATPEGIEEKTDASPLVAPPCPPMEKKFGDKTPAVVEWYRQYRPEEYKTRYGIIGDGTVTKYRKQIVVKNGFQTEELIPTVVQGTLAHRKTHVTELATDTENS
jgi:hypothetical protein